MSKGVGGPAPQEKAIVKVQAQWPDWPLCTAEDLAAWRKDILAAEKLLKAKNAEVKAAIENRIDGGADVPGFAVEVTTARQCPNLTNLCQFCRRVGMTDDVFHSCLKLGMDKIENAYAALLKDRNGTSKARAVAEFRYRTSQQNLIVDGKEQRKLVQT